jgi:hypothetical protein
MTNLQAIGAFSATWLAVGAAYAAYHARSLPPVALDGMRQLRTMVPPRRWTVMVGWFFLIAAWACPLFMLSGVFAGWRKLLQPPSPYVPSDLAHAQAEAHAASLDASCRGGMQQALDQGTPPGTWSDDYLLLECSLAGLSETSLARFMSELGPDATAALTRMKDRMVAEQVARAFDLDPPVTPAVAFSSPADEAPPAGGAS